MLNAVGILDETLTGKSSAQKLHIFKEKEASL